MSAAISLGSDQRTTSLDLLLADVNLQPDQENCSRPNEEAKKGGGAGQVQPGVLHQETRILAVDVQVLVDYVWEPLDGCS